MAAVSSQLAASPAEAELFGTENRLEQAVAMAADELTPAEITAVIGGMLRTADPSSSVFTGASYAAGGQEASLDGGPQAIAATSAVAVAVPLECRAPLGVKMHAVFVVASGKLKLVDFAAGYALNDQTKQRIAAALEVDPERTVEVTVISNSIEQRRLGGKGSDVRGMVRLTSYA